MSFFGLVWFGLLGLVFVWFGFCLVWFELLGLVFVWFGLSCLVLVLFWFCFGFL